MLRRSREKNTKEAVRHLRKACTGLQGEPINLTTIDRAETHLKTATNKLDQAVEGRHQEASTSIMLRAAANAASAAQNQLARGHRDLEDAYISEQDRAPQQSMKMIIERAAASALSETQAALELLEEAGVTRPAAAKANGMLDGTQKKAAMIVGLGAIALATLTVLNPQGFTLWAAVTAFTAQQSAMICAVAKSNTTTPKTDFYTRTALCLTAVVALCLILTGLGPRAVITLSTATVILVAIEWGTAKAISLHYRQASNETTV